MSVKEYILNNLTYISHPFNTAGQIVLPDLKSVCQLLEDFLKLSSYQQLGNQITTAIEDHQKLAFVDVTRRILNLKSLVLTVEPLIKILGRLVHANNIEVLTRLENQSFRSLLEHGLILPKMNWDENYTNKKHCQNYWAQQDCLPALAYQVYLLRNEFAHGNEFAHETPKYPIERISTLFNSTLSLILLTIRHTPNRVVLELEISPYRSYIEWISQNLDPEYDNYVPLQANLKWEPNLLDEQRLIPLTTDMTSSVILPKEIDNVSILIKQVDKMILAGEGGAGKSRTLRYTAAKIAREIMSLQLTPQQIPVYLPADILNGRENFSNQLSRFLQTIHLSEIQSSLEIGRYWLFIDGLNEVAPQRYLETIQEIKTILINYPRCRVIIATRHETYNNQLFLPIYDLQKLSPYGVKQILISNSETEEQGSQLFNGLSKNKRLLALFKTPLMSKLLCKLPKEIRIPRSTAELMSTIFSQIFEREERKSDRISRTIKNMALIELAKRTRYNSGTALTEESILQIFRDITQDFARDISPNLLLLGFLESGILERRNNDSISFFHETALDYFYALGLKKIWDASYKDELCEEIISTNATVIQMLAGLITNIDHLITYISKYDLKLASQCYSARSNRSLEIFNNLMETIKSLLTNSVDEQILAVQSMVALDEDKATKEVFKWLPKLSKEAGKKASLALIEYVPSGAIEEVYNALESGEFIQKLVAIRFASANQLIELDQTLITLAEQGQVALKNVLAMAIGRLETSKTITYLECQLEMALNERSIPLDIAINSAVSEFSKNLLLKALFNSEASIRKAALSRIEELDIAYAYLQMVDIVKADSDFSIRLIGTQILLHSANELEREDIVKSMFSADVLESDDIPKAIIIKLLSSLRLNELEDILLQILCQSNKVLKSLVVDLLLKRNPKLALNFFDFIDFQDSKVPSGVKSAFIKAVIVTHDITPEMLQKGTSSAVQIGVRRSVAQMLASLPEESFEPTLKIMLKDPEDNVKLEVFKTLCNSTKCFSDSIIFPFLYESSQLLQKWAWRLVNERKLFSNSKLLSLIKEDIPKYSQMRVIQELCERRFQWSLRQACNFARDNDYIIRWHGYNILKAILSESDETIGKVINYKVSPKHGFIICLDNSKEKIFFKLNNINDRRYIPRYGDIVAFKINRMDNSDKICAENIRFLG